MPVRKAYVPQPQRQKARSGGKRAESLWDLYRDGITYSLLSKYFVCPERFRLKVVEGWSETGLRASLEFGNAFHACLEHLPQPAVKTLEVYQRRMTLGGGLHPSQVEEFEKLMAMVEGSVGGYLKYWNKDQKEIDWVDREAVFDLPYEIEWEPGKKVKLRLRGKRDGLFRNRKDGNKLWIFETKTKSEIDHEGLHRTLSQDLQTMMYSLVAEREFGEKLGGVLYNVIRVPQLRVKKGESLREFSIRLQQDVLERSEHYFHRWMVKFDKNDLENWRVRSFNPLLSNIVRWWESIKADPFNPWKSSYHFQRPYGIYDGLAAGRRGDFFELLTSGNHAGLKMNSSVFPELEEGTNGKEG